MPRSSRVPSKQSSNAKPGAAKIQGPDDDGRPIVGWSDSNAAAKTVGFTRSAARTAADISSTAIYMPEEGNLFTIAPTGAGKGLCCSIPALLRHRGAAIVIDPKGENVAVTARRRQELGQEIVVLDLAEITGMATGRLNPLDLIDPEDATGVDNAAALASALLPANIDSERNRFWVNRARQLLIAAILHVVTDLPPGEKTLIKVRELIGQISSDPQEVAQRLRGSRHPEVRRIQGNLKISATETLGGILAFAQEGVDFLRGPQIEKAIASTSFDLDKVVRGSPLTIYIVIPPHLLEPLGRLLRLWVGMLLNLVMRRRSRPARPTLFLLDEAAQLGEMAELRAAVTLLRGYGLQTWSFWQDVSQLKYLYPADWKTMLNNCKIIQAFGPLNLEAAADMTELVGSISAEELLSMGSGKMLLQVGGNKATVAVRPNYLTDEVFKGLFDPNPLFDTRRDLVPPARRLEGYLLPRGSLTDRPPRGRPSLYPRLANPLDTMLAGMINRLVGAR